MQESNLSLSIQCFPEYSLIERYKILFNALYCDFAPNPHPLGCGHTLKQMTADVFFLYTKMRGPIIWMFATIIIVGFHKRKLSTSYVRPLGRLKIDNHWYVCELCLRTQWIIGHKIFARILSVFSDTIYMRSPQTEATEHSFFYFDELRLLFRHSLSVLWTQKEDLYQK